MWHPIETFPRDGNSYIVRLVESGYVVCFFSDLDKCLKESYLGYVFEFTTGDEWTYIPD